MANANDEAGDEVLLLVRIVTFKSFCLLSASADVDVQTPDEKSIITYVAQFLQYSNDMPAPDDHLQVGSQTAWKKSLYLGFLVSFVHSPANFSA